MTFAPAPGLATVAATPVAPRDGLLTRLDPRLRVGAALAFALLVAALSSLAALGAALAAALALMALSGLAPRATLRRMAAMDGFILIMLILLPFTTPGAPIATLPGGLTASQQGLHLAIDIALTANAVILMLMVLVGTMDPVTLGHALGRLRVPAALVHLMLFTVRYIEVLRAEQARMRQAMKARGFRPRTDLHTLRSLGYLVGMLLVRAFERSERILQAMKCRGFTGHLPLLDDMRLRRADLCFALAFAALLTALAGLELGLVRIA